MLAVRRSQKVNTVFCSSLHGFRSLLHQSLSSSAAKPTNSSSQTNLMADYLVKSLGFTTQEAISAAAKVRPFKSTPNFDSILEVFTRYGFDNAQMKTMVSSVPKILLLTPDKTLEPKLRFFKDVGFSPSDIAYVVICDRHILDLGLDSTIKPRVSQLRILLGSDDNVVRVVRDTTWLISSSTSLKRLQEALVLFEKCGLSDAEIQRLVILAARLLVVYMERIQEVIEKVKGELGIPVDSKMFIHAIRACISVTPENTDKKIGVFKSYGWSDSDINKIIRANPNIIGYSEDKLSNGLDFYMNEIGYAPAYVASRPCLLTYGLEKRVKPRNEVLKILKENKLVDSKKSLYSFLTLTESKFIEKCILPYVDVIPDLLKKYTDGFK